MSTSRLSVTYPFRDAVGGTGWETVPVVLGVISALEIGYRIGGAVGLDRGRMRK